MCVITYTNTTPEFCVIYILLLLLLAEPEVYAYLDLYFSVKKDTM